VSSRIDYKKLDIEQLVILSQQDDFKSLEELIRKIQKDVYAMLSYLLKNTDDLSDLTQEVLLKVAKNIHNLKNPKCFKGWLNQIITHTYYDYVRKNKKLPETVSLDYNCEPLNLSIKFEPSDKDIKPIEKCITSECENLIKSAIRELPEAFRIAIVLREFQGLSYNEIAKNTNSNVGTVKSRISRARIKLQEALKGVL
jgi:RNA polymerase sigma-70 factor (ECF subfamily)